MGSLATLISALVLSATVAGGLGNEPIEDANEQFRTGIGERAISYLCDPKDIYLSCVPLSPQQCEDELSNVVAYCFDLHGSSIPDLEAEGDPDIEGLKRFGEAFGSCLTDRHIATGDFDRAEARACFEAD